MARKMAETGDWITPQFDYGIPFWGKPPLSIWVSASGIVLFGSSAAAARLPLILISIAVLTLLYCWIKKHRGKDTALVATVLLATTPIYFYLSSAVMTDLVLTSCATLAMVSFHRKVAEDDKILWGYLFFISLGLGFLAKGPAALVLITLPLFMWTALCKQWRNVTTKLPWISGTLISGLIGIPWYIIAEAKTPGFINYFIVGEHFSRFLISGWKGDLYGSAHNEPIGTIWLFWVLTALPWSLVLLFKLASFLRNRSWRQVGKNRMMLLYLACWAAAPLLFFTFARNIISTYVFTGIPALPFLIVELDRRTSKKTSKVKAPVFAVLCTFTFLLCIGSWILPTYYPDKTPKSSQYQIVYYYQSQATENSRLSYWKKRFNSAEFYMNGNLRTLNNAAEVQALVNDDVLDYVVISNKKSIPEELKPYFEEVKTFKGFSLLRERQTKG